MTAWRRCPRVIPTVQFDPASLAIWTTSGSLIEPEASFAQAAMEAAMRGEDPAPVLGQLSGHEALSQRLRWLASSIWHEKRHFFDTCLTNYGARRFRDLFALGSNLLPLASGALKQRKPLWFPVEVYSCPIRRRVLGIDEPAPNILQMAQLARGMKKFSGQLDAPIFYEGHALQLGGEAQLEGLAQTSQLHSIEHRWGTGELVAMTRDHVQHLPRDGPYRTIEAVSATLGCVREAAEGVLAVNSSLAAAMFVTSLCGRFFGSGMMGSEQLVSPQARLAQLLDALGPTPGRYEMSAEEAWTLVDVAAKHLWGRGALEELEADIEASEATAETFPAWMDELGLRGAFEDFTALRRRLLSVAREAGPGSLLPRAFPERWLDRLFPWHVVATPGGKPGDGGAPIVFGHRWNVPAAYEALVPSLISWGRLHTASSGHDHGRFAPRNRDAWLQMLERHVPNALLMLNGRRHRRMVPPELERAITDLENMGVEVRFDPHFEWPESREHAVRKAEAAELSRFSGRKRFTCDITGNDLDAADAAVLTPWELRRSPLLSHVRASGFAGEILLLRDWSDWVVQDDLLDEGAR